ncbi:MAG: aminofutalosine synthase MqnE [Syntrophomonadaceae bacterium]|nr:aminofutalosine synthase MqnE [Syntrophomonadaceae bacterium]
MSASTVSADSVKEKVFNNIRLTKEDGLFLYKECDFLDLAGMAKAKKRQLSGAEVYFNVNCHINLSNVCVSRCKFCAFGRNKEDEGAYSMSPEEAFDYGSAYVETGITEFHVVSAMHPDRQFSYYVDVISRLHNAYPHIHIQGFTAVEIYYFAQISGLSVRQVLTELKNAGLGSMPGGGAEILNDDIRAGLCPNKAGSREWLDVHSSAHELGMKTNCTMLYGHVETLENRIEHMMLLRELQDQTGGFQAFIPLPFLPENTGISHITRTGSLDDLRTIAVSRLMLDNIRHIKAFWIMLTLPIAQISLDFGADDLDGTIVEERIMHAANANTEKGISKSHMVDLIKKSGYIPCERDTVYNILHRYNEGVTEEI